jgi:hypothetical protein
MASLPVGFSYSIIKDGWDYKQLLHVAHPSPHISMFNPLAIENDRTVHQQALSMITNLDDVESYLREKEAERGATYLQVFDLPFESRTSPSRTEHDGRYLGVAVPWA